MKYYFTFGFGTPYKDCYLEIEAENYDAAREEMVRLHGTKWAFQYTEEEFKGQVEKYNLVPLHPSMPAL